MIYKIATFDIFNSKFKDIGLVHNFLSLNFYLVHLLDQVNFVEFLLLLTHAYFSIDINMENL